MVGLLATVGDRWPVTVGSGVVGFVVNSITAVPAQVSGRTRDFIVILPDAGSFLLIRSSFFNRLVGRVTRIHTAIRYPILIWNRIPDLTTSIGTIRPRLCNRNHPIGRPINGRWS
jgi:hypothetical protein